MVFIGFLGEHMSTAKFCNGLLRVLTMVDADLKLKRYPLRDEKVGPIV